MPSINSPATHSLHSDPIIVDFHQRITSLEAKDNLHTTEMALMKQDLTYLKENVGAIRGGVNRVLWAIALSAAAAATTFVMSGGLVIVQ